MKKIRHFLSNIQYMTRVTYKFAKGQYFLSAFLFIWNTATPFVNLLFPKWILDELSGERSWNKLLFLLILWATVNGIMVLIQSIVNIFSNPYLDKNTYKENMHYLKFDAEMDYSKIENGRTLDEQGRIATNLSLAYFANNTIFTLLGGVIQLAGYTYILATLHPLVIVLILVLIFLNSLIAKKLNGVDYVYQQTISPHQRRFAYLFHVLTEYSFAKETRINHADTWIQSKYADESQAYMSQFSKNQNTHLKFGLLSDVILFLQTLILYLYSAFRVMNKTITIGDFSLYIGTTTAFIGSVTTVVYEMRKMKYLSQYIDDYRAFINQVSSSHTGVQENDIANSDTHEIVFENVSFKYPGQENYALKNISLTIRHGERLSIIGYNGAGKSTLIKLICRLYSPTEGRILYNGTDISTLKYEQYAKLLSVIFQDYNIYAMSVRDNVVLNGETNDSELMNVIEKSGLAEKIHTLPCGVNTQLGRDFDENGIEFSGGEAQKLSCARAYYKNAPIVILDEPTASLDPISEHQLYTRFNDIIGQKTAIYITHRLASVRFCNRIAVMAHGKLIECGTHEELMENKNVYYEMFTKQAEFYVETTAGEEV